MAVVSFLVIGATLALSLWTLWTTLRPEAGRIAALLFDKAVTVTSLPVAMPARGNLRDVGVRAIRLSSPRRAAA